MRPPEEGTNEQAIEAGSGEAQTGTSAQVRQAAGEDTGPAGEYREGDTEHAAEEGQRMAVLEER